MKNKAFLIIIVIVVIIGIALVFVFTTKKAGEKVTSKKTRALTIESQDKKVIMEIPENALPENISKSDIKLTKIKVEDLGIGLKEGELNAQAFELLPDGLILEKPANITLNLEPASKAIPMVLHVFGEDKKIEIIDKVEVDTDFSENSTVIIFPISHFSKFTVVNYVKAGIEVKAVAETPVGETVQAVANIKLSEWGRPKSLTQSIYVKGSISSRGVLTPSGPIENRPRSEAHWMTFPFQSQSTDFSCSKEGEGSINWSFELKGRQQYVRVRTADGNYHDSIDKASQSGSKTIDTWSASRDVVVKMDYTVSANCENVMVLANPPVTIICPDGRSFTVFGKPYPPGAEIGKDGKVRNIFGEVLDSEPTNEDGTPISC